MKNKWLHGCVHTCILESKYWELRKIFSKTRVKQGVTRLCTVNLPSSSELSESIGLSLTLCRRVSSWFPFFGLNSMCLFCSVKFWCWYSWFFFSWWCRMKFSIEVRSSQDWNEGWAWSWQWWERIGKWNWNTVLGRKKTVTQQKKNRGDKPGSLLVVYLQNQKWVIFTDFYVFFFLIFLYFCVFSIFFLSFFFFVYFSNSNHLCLFSSIIPLQLTCSFRIHLRRRR